MAFTSNSKVVLSGIERAAERGVTKCVLMIEAEAKQRAPVHDGQLRMGIGHKVDKRKNGVSGRVFSHANYSASYEFGRKPGKMPPISALKKWCKDKLGDENLAFVVARKIALYGTVNSRYRKPFMRPAIDNTHRQCVATIKKELAKEGAKSASIR